MAQAINTHLDKSHHLGISPLLQGLRPPLSRRLIHHRLGIRQKRASQAQPLARQPGQVFLVMAKPRLTAATRRLPLPATAHHRLPVTAHPRHPVMAHHPRHPAMAHRPRLLVTAHHPHLEAGRRPSAAGARA